MQINPQDIQIDVKSHSHWGRHISSEVTIKHIPTGEIETAEGRMSQHRLRDIAFSRLQEKLNTYPEQLELFE